MKVEMLAHITGTRDGQEWPQTGGVIDLPKDEADELIGVGYARIPVGAAAEQEPTNAPAQDDQPAEDGDTAGAGEGDEDAAGDSDEAAAEPGEPTVDLTKLTKAQLVELAAERGVDTSGTKAKLLERLTA